MAQNEMALNMNNGGQLKRLSEEACETLWGIVRDYMERHGGSEPRGLALGLLTASLELADKQRAGQLCEAELVRAEGLGGLAESPRRLRREGAPWNGEPLSQEDIIQELISAYHNDPEIVVRLEDFAAKYLNKI